MLLSVVIPVYRTELTLQRCVESVLKQGVDDMEVILVDDGSPDNCPQLCDEWAEKDNHIKVIHKTNGGLSDARNAGIDVATGDYITFVDSDDYLATNTYRALLEILTAHPEYDLLEFPSSKYDLTDTVYTQMNEYLLKGEAYRHSYACTKIYRRSLFDSVRFPVGRVFEDIYILPSILEHCHIVATTRRGFYHYIQHAGGITMQADGRQISMLLEGLMTLLSTLKDSPDSMELQQLYLHTLNIQLETYSKQGPIILHPYQGKLALRSQYTVACNIKIIIYHLFGITRLCQIYKILNRIILHR
jgi:glycosyltransferase involved in cell wall biosynthesis